MLNLKAIREDAEPFIAALKKRNASSEPIEQIISLDKQWRTLKQESDSLKADRNIHSKKINDAKKEGKDISDAIEKTRIISNRIKEMDEKASSLEARMNEILLTVPNTPHESVPLGKDESENVEVGKWGKPLKTSSDILPHYELGPKCGLMDFERGVKLAGSRFSVLYGELAKLERAISFYMLETASKNGYLEVAVPYIANTKALTGSGQLPKFAQELYALDGTDLWLIPTSEVQLGNLHADETLDEQNLPLNYCALTPNFRKEAGNYQKDIKGYIRQHQFNKVELFKYCLPDDSFNEHELLLKDAQSVLQGLDLPYRTMLLCSGDMGFASSKTYDLEVWLPSQDTYREISSVSNCTDFQARRANIKFRRDNKNEYVHTLNGSGLAVGRTLVAIMENYQEDNCILIPKALQGFMQSDKIEF
ncbi:MAG: serine--tRNA ligase [Candidatus Micrarchaeia archaeon]